MFCPFINNLFSHFFSYHKNFVFVPMKGQLLANQKFEDKFLDANKLRVKKIGIIIQLMIKFL